MLVVGRGGIGGIGGIGGREACCGAALHRAAQACRKQGNLGDALSYAQQAKACFRQQLNDRPPEEERPEKWLMAGLAMCYIVKAEYLKARPPPLG